MLLVTSIIAEMLRYDPASDQKTNAYVMKNVPLNFGKWHGKDVNLDTQVYEILETKNIIHRAYISDDGENVFLSIVHYNDTKVDFHAPEACIGGRGLKTKKTTKTITLLNNGVKKDINIAEMITTRPTEKTLTYYFFKTGEFLGQNYIRMRLSIAKNKIMHNDTSGSLIRVSTNLPPNNYDKSADILAVFLQDIFPKLQETL